MAASRPLLLALFCPPKAPSRVRLPWRDLGIVEQEATRARGQALALSAYVCRAPVQAAVLQELVRHCVCCDCSPGAAAAGGVLFRPRSAGKRGSRRVRSAATSNRQHGLAGDRLCWRVAAGTRKKERKNLTGLLRAPPSPSACVQRPEAVAHPARTKSEACCKSGWSMPCPGPVPRRTPPTSWGGGRPVAAWWPVRGQGAA